MTYLFRFPINAGVLNAILSSPVFVDYLRGVEVIAATTFLISGSYSQTSEWEGHGLKLHFPECALPREGCRIGVKAGLGGQFEFPESCYLVSGVYWLSCEKNFQKRVTVEMQHCLYSNAFYLWFQPLLCCCKMFPARAPIPIPCHGERSVLPSQFLW